MGSNPPTPARGVKRGQNAAEWRMTMKTTVNGKRYNSDTCEDLGAYDHHSNGNYSGTTHLLRAKNGAYLAWTNSNGQDGYLCDDLHVIEDCELDEMVDSIRPSEDQEARLIGHGLIEVV